MRETQKNCSGRLATSSNFSLVHFGVKALFVYFNLSCLFVVLCCAVLQVEDSAASHTF